MLDAVISLVVFGERALFLFLFIRKKTSLLTRSTAQKCCKNDF